VRREREHCCDDLAVGVCDRLVYATALADLATLTAPRSFALAATDGSLLDRVRRILGQKSDERASTSPWLPVSFVGLIAVAVLPIAFVSAQSQEPRTAAPVGVAEAVVAERPKPIETLRPVLAEVREQRALKAVSSGVRDEVAVLAEVSEQNRSEVAGTIAEIRRQLEDTRDRVAIASQQGADQSQIEDLRKRLAALEQQLAKMLVEQRDRTDTAKQLTAQQEALLKARQQDIERQAERMKMLFEKGLVSEDQARRAEIDKQRALFEHAIKERAEVSDEARVKIQRQFEELNKQLLSRDLERSEAERAQALIKEKLAAADLFGQMEYRRAEDDSRLSEDARKLISRALDEKTADDELVATIKNVTNLKEDSDRAAVLVRIARGRRFTANMVSAYLSAANTIRSDYDRERVFKQPITLKAGR
jgi:hypothetical protein